MSVTEPFRVTRQTDDLWVVLADGAMTGGGVAFGEARLPPRTAGPSYHQHSREDEAAYVVEGTMTFRVDEDRFEAGPGTLVWLPRGVPHTFANLADAPARVFGTISPAGLEGMFRAQAEYFATLTGPPDEAQIEEIGARWGVQRMGPPLALDAPTHGRTREGSMLTTAWFDRHLVSAMGIVIEHAGDAGLVDARDHVAVTAAGRGPDEFNTAWVLDMPNDPEATLAWAHDLLANRPPPFMVQVPDQHADDLDPVLRDLGLQLSYRAPGMARATTTDVPAPPPGLHVRQVHDAAALEAHVLATAIGFGAPDATAMAGLMPASLLDDGRVTFLNGHVDGSEVPAATAVCVVAEGLAGIYAITVHESVRRRGIGAAMTWAALAAGGRAGCPHAVLQSSAMGRPVYQRMGFSPVRVHHHYRPQAPEPATDG